MCPDAQLRKVSQKYSFDASRLSLRECFQLGVMNIPILLMGKMLGINFVGQTQVVSEVREFHSLSREELSAEASETLEPANREVERLGGVFCFYYSLPEFPNSPVASVFVSPDRTICFENHFLVENQNPTVYTLLVSPRKTSGVVTTTNQRRTLQTAPEDLVEYRPKASVPQLLERHSKSLKLTPTPTCHSSPKRSRLGSWKTISAL